MHKIYYTESIAVPTLHIFGESDNIIPSEMSEDLANVFIEPKILIHDGGHYFPATTKQKQFYKEHFQDLLLQHLEAKELKNANGLNTIELSGQEAEENDKISSDDE